MIDNNLWIKCTILQPKIYCHHKFHQDHQEIRILRWEAVCKILELPHWRREIIWHKVNHCPKEPGMWAYKKWLKQVKELIIHLVYKDTRWSIIIHMLINQQFLKLLLRLINWKIIFRLYKSVKPNYQDHITIKHKNLLDTNQNFTWLKTKKSVHFSMK